MAKKDAAFAFARHVATVQYDDLPREAVEVTKIDILDALGAALAASTTSPTCREMAVLARELGGKEESSIIAYGGKVPCHMAAFVNAALVWSLNYNDLYDEYCCHPGCVVFSSAFAAAERMGKVSGKEFITAYTLGLDIEGRLGRAIFPPVLFRDWALYGLFTPQMLGYFGSVTAAGRLLGLNEEKMLSAFGLAYCQTAGNWEPLYGIGADKGIWPSFPAMSGVLAALMAQRGIAGPKNSFEGIAGFFKVYFQGEYDAPSLTAKLGEYFKGVELSFYAFPCCALAHPYVALALQLRKEHSFNPQDVEQIKVFVSGKTERLCQPLEERSKPQTLYAAQMSLPFSVATAVAKGKPRIEYFTPDGIKDPEVLRLAGNVTWQTDSECDRHYGTGLSPAKLELTLTGGKVLRAESKGHRYGHPQNPMSKNELIEKFRDCATYSAKPLSQGDVEKLISLISRLEELEDIRQVIRLVS